MKLFITDRYGEKRRVRSVEIDAVNNTVSVYDDEGTHFYPMDEKFSVSGPAGHALQAFLIWLCNHIEDKERQ